MALEDIACLLIEQESIDAAELQAALDRHPFDLASLGLAAPARPTLLPPPREDVPPFRAGIRRVDGIADTSMEHPEVHDNPRPRPDNRVLRRTAIIHRHSRPGPITLDSVSIAEFAPEPERAAAWPRARDGRGGLGRTRQDAPAPVFSLKAVLTTCREDLSACRSRSPPVRGSGRDRRPVAKRKPNRRRPDECES